MTSRTRWGILATGGIAGTFVEDLALLPDAEVTAVGSRTLDAARRFAARHEIPRAHGSWADLAADPEVDVVYVATPHSAHHAATRMCLEAGKAVLCEKPFTLDLATTRELVDIARGNGLIESSLLAKTFGILAWLGAVSIVYFTWRKQKHQTDEIEQNV